MAEHPHIKGSIDKPVLNLSRLPAAGFHKPIMATQPAISSELSAIDGSRRLAVAICQYHVKHAKTQKRSHWWAQRCKEISFGS